MSDFEKFENVDDRTNQQRVADALMAHLSSYDVVGTGLDNISYFTYTETKIELNEPEDIHISHHGRPVAVAEIKSRGEPYDLDYMITDGILITSQRLNDLMKFHKQGMHVLIVTETSDGRIIYTTMQRLYKYSSMLETVDGVLKTDHGKKDKAGTGTIIPTALHTEALTWQKDS